MRGAVPGSNRATTSKKAHHAKPMKKMHGGRRGGKLRSMTIEPAVNGGFVVQHHQDMGDGGYQSPEQHALGSAQELHDHVAEHFPVSKGRGNMEEAGEAMPDDEGAE